MGKYDGPSFYKNEHPKVEPINGKKPTKKVPKYELPDAVRTRDDLEKEAHQYMETPSYLNRRFRSTKIPNSLQHLEGWKQSRRNHQLIEEISERLTIDFSDYLLFEEFLKEESEPAPVPELSLQLEPEAEVEPEKSEPSDKSSNGVTLVKNDLVNLQFGQKSADRKKLAPSKQRKAEVVQEKMEAAKHKPNSGLHRSLSTIIADDKKAMKQWNSNLDSLFSDEKKSKK